jgi:hypothetical protein
MGAERGDIDLQDFPLLSRIKRSSWIYTVAALRLGKIWKKRMNFLPHQPKLPGGSPLIMYFFLRGHQWASKLTFLS